MSRLLPPPPMLFLLPHVTEAFPFFLSSLAFMLTSVSSRLYLLVLSGPLLCFLSITQTAGSHPGVRVWPPKNKTLGPSLSVWAWRLASAQLLA